jgi:glycosyltransferase involved in cell wall biosynthesis
MRKFIVIPAYNRPLNLQIMLNSLKAQLLPLDDYEIIISIDGEGDKAEEVIRVAEDFGRAQVFRHKTRLRLNHNTFWLMDYVFSYLWATHVVYIEDDVILSPDALNLVEWYISHAKEMRFVDDIDDISAYCLCQLHWRGEPDRVYLAQTFVSWAFLIDRYQWERYFRPAWRDPRKTWDKATDRYIRLQGDRIYNAFPELSRASNTGREGTTFTPEKFDILMDGHEYNQGREAYDFQFVGTI